MCPGLPNSSGLILGSTSAFIVFALSEAEIPVVQPCPIKSTEIVNGVSCNAVFLPISPQIGCALSHMKALRDARNNGYGVVTTPLGMNIR